MEEKPKDNESDPSHPEDGPTALPAPSEPVPEPSKPEQQRKFRPDLKKLPRWLMAGVLVILFVGLLASCFLLYQKSNDLCPAPSKLNTHPK